MAYSIFVNLSTTGQVSSSELSEKLSTPIVVAFGIYYFPVLLIGLVGNIFIIVAVLKYNHMKKVVNVFLANLALSDLLFAVLTIFDSYTLYRGEWVFGEIFCRMQGTLIEVSYTVSVLTLTAVSAERYFSICYPFRKKHTYQQSQVLSFVLWLLGFLFCAVLLHGYTTQAYLLPFTTDLKGQVIFKCENGNWSSTTRLAFYITHSIFVYFLPISFMCWSHIKISRVLIQPKKHFTSKNKTYPKACCDNKNNLNKNKHEAKMKSLKVVKLLVAVTMVFFVLWTPFIALRLLKYLGVKVPNNVWRISQLLILGTTAANCVIYSLISKPFRLAFKGLLMCLPQISGNETEFDSGKNTKELTLNNRLHSNTAIN
ncbi:muscarinic acetylcholine receptor M3 [Hydra vulgaris]|uniref:Muscarinic acetylcholine receptor M3 n=1 Tax=Hydra vulgaris TaxID=6087 RepID=A0ABM4CVN9_HYDVU